MLATEYRLFVGGEWVKADSGDIFEVADPATGETCAILPDGGREDMQAALEAVMNSIKNGLVMRKTRIANTACQPWNSHFYGVSTQVHNTL